jgi:chitinase
MGGTKVFFQTRETSGTAYLLKPNTTYTFTTMARDAGGNWSPASAPVTVTTLPSDPNDVTPPSAPVFNGQTGLLDATELWVFWDDSTDNVTPQNFIRYDLYLNGVFEGTAIDFNRLIVYLTPGIVNTLKLYATDEAGNRSLASTLTFDLRSP